MKAKVICAYVLCVYLIFLPGVVTEISGNRLVLLKFGIFLLGNVCGFGLQKTLSQMSLKKS